MVSKSGLDKMGEASFGGRNGRLGVKLRHVERPPRWVSVVEVITVISRLPRGGTLQNRSR